MENENSPQPEKTPKAGGFFMFIGAIAGAFIGGYQGEPVIGLLAGFVAGTLLAVAIWFMDGRKS